MKLYRGVSKELDTQLDGKLLPKGKNSEVVALFDGKTKFDGTFTFGHSEENAARAHQIETGLYDGCFVSTSRSEELAARFATNDFSCEGWIYVLDSDLFERFGVVSLEFSDPLYPEEQEVSVHAADNGEIPAGVIIEKYEVFLHGGRK